MLTLPVAAVIYEMDFTGREMISMPVPSSERLAPAGVTSFNLNMMNLSIATNIAKRNRPRRAYFK